MTCRILVHPSIQRLSQSTELNALMPVVTVGQELSTYLLEIQREERPRAAARWFEDRFNTLQPGPVGCVQIDLLFEPAFNLDPLHLFRQASRVTELVVQWPGEYVDGILSYAVPEHRHYRTWRITDPGIALIRLAD